MEGLSEERVAGEEHDDEGHDDADEGWVGDVISYCTIDVAACACPTCAIKEHQSELCVWAAKYGDGLQRSRLCRHLHATCNRTRARRWGRETRESLNNHRCQYASPTRPQGYAINSKPEAARRCEKRRGRFYPVRGPCRQKAPCGRRGHRGLNKSHKSPRNV